MNEYLNDMVNALQWLLRIDSVEDTPSEGKPFGEGCYKALEYTLALSKSLGLNIKNIDNYAGHAEIGEGELFGILLHLDTVPHGSGWTYPPTGGVVDNGRIYGRGALDDKGPVIACLYAIKALLDQGLTPIRKVRLIYGCNEESGWKCIDYYKEHEGLPEIGFAPDADFPVINCEKGVSYYTVKLPLPPQIIKLEGGMRANMVPDYAMAELSIKPLNTSDTKVSIKDNSYIIESLGKSVHASNPSKGINAIWRVLFALPDDLDNGIQLIKNKLTTTDGDKCNLNLSDTVSGSLTMNLGKARTENSEMIFSVDVRHPVTITKESILSVLRQELAGLTVEQGPFHNPLYVEPNHPLVKTLLEAYNDVTGSDEKPITIGGGTYARALPLGVAYGPVFPGQVSTIHCADENILIDDLLLMSKVYYEAIKRLCFTK